LQRKVLAVRFQIDTAQLNLICQTITQWLIQFEEATVSEDRARGYDFNSERNCAGFVQACCESAGIMFPDAVKVPTYNSRLGMVRVATPNALYAGLNLSPYSFNPITTPATAQSLAPQGIGMFVPRLSGN
jgi:hypothetical protein